MNRRVLRILLLVTIGLVLLAAASILSYQRPRHRACYTDGDTIRRATDETVPRDVLWQPARTLPAPINSDRDEYEPRLTNDGLMLYFVRGRAGEDADLYVCHRTSAGWSEPTPLDDINTDADELGPEPAPDGAALYFYSDRPGGSGGYDLWRSRRTETGWTTPVNLGTAVNTGFNEYGPAITPDGKHLIFASNRPREPDGALPDPDAWPATVREDHYHRDYDLYAAAVSDRGLGSPAPLHNLNSPYNDGAPCASPAGDFLYFTSDRPGGYGGFDILRSRRLRGRYLPPDNAGPSVNSPAGELDPALAAGGFALYFSSDRPPLASVGGAASDYNLFVSNSREVFIETEEYRASIDWSALLPYLVWLLLTLLLLLLLLLFARLVRSGHYGKLSLLARCVLASALVHVIVLVLLTFWGVSSSLSHWINERGGTRVALVSPAAGNELAAQIRGDLTGLRIEPPAAEPKSQLRTRSRPPIPLAVSAVLEVARSRLATNDVTRPEQLEDAPARARPTASTRPPPPVRNTHAVNVKLPPPVSRGREQEAARHISATPAVSSNARKHHSHASVFGPSPFAEESPGPAPLPNMAPDPASRVVAALSSHRISHPERPTLTPPRSLLPSRQTLPEIPPISTAPTSAQAEPVISARTDQPFSTKQDAGALHVADRPAEAIPRRVDPPPQTPVSGHAESSFAAATPAPSPSRTITAPPPPPQPVLPALAADTPVMPEHTHCASELTTAPPPSAIAGAARLRHHDHRTTPASHDPAIHDSGRPAPTPGRYPRLITSDSRDTDPDALPSASSARRPAGIVLAAVPPIPIGLPPVGDQSESVATGEQTLAVAPDDTRFSHRRRTSNTGMLSRASSSLPFRLDPSSPAIPDDHPRSALSFPVSDTQARRAPRSDSLSSSTPVSLPRLVFELSAVEPSRPAHRLESTFSSSTPQAIRARRALRTRTNGNLHVAPQVPLPAAASIRRVALPDESRRFTELPRPDIAPAGDQSGLFAFTSTQPAQPPAIRFPADLPLLPDEAPAVAPERAAVDITGAVRGMVRDARTGEPLADVTVRLDLADRPAIAVITGPQGDYLLLTPPVPDFVALSASHEGYVPETVNIAADELDHAIVTRDFRLSPKQKDIIALEADPDVHHLGDDRFTGRINSRFQKRSEGRRYAGVFELAADQLPRSEGQAKVLFLVRGAQRNNRIRINDQLLDTRLNRAPRDGSFGPFQATFPASWLREGTNTLEIRSVYGGSDYDDFEFVNIRIRLPGVD